MYYLVSVHIPKYNIKLLIMTYIQYSKVLKIGKGRRVVPHLLVLASVCHTCALSGFIKQNFRPV